MSYGAGVGIQTQHLVYDPYSMCDSNGVRAKDNYTVA